MLSSVLFGSNTGSLPASNPLLAQANCHTTTFWGWVSPVVLDCLQPITSCGREKLTSTPSPQGMIENLSCASLQRSAYFECVPSCCRHQSVISSNQMYYWSPLGRSGNH
jgi:hypothetical protein